jgi:hypothetical protein
MSLNPLDEADNEPLGFGLDADIGNDGTNLILTIDHKQKNARRLLTIPSHFLFDRAPDLTVTSPVLSPEISYMFSFSVYLNDGFIHSESEDLKAVTLEGYPTEVCALKTTLLLNDNWQKVIRSTGEFSRFAFIDISSQLFRYRTLRHCS